MTVGKTSNWMNCAAGVATWSVSLLNGMVGDYMHERGNGLAVEMAFYHAGKPLVMDRAHVAQAYPQATSKLCILVHGLGCNERLWSFADPAQPEQPVDYGSLLQAELGYTPFYVRYNTGLALAHNGTSLAQLIAALWEVYPLPITEIVCIGHSMGGLVLRSACHVGTQDGAPWVSQISRVFYLGTPHEGANLEKVATTSAGVLTAIPNAITQLVGDVLNLRSNGIKDLHSGALYGADKESPSTAMAWLSDSQHYVIAGTLTTEPGHALSVLLGDGLVLQPRQAWLDAAGDAIPPSNVRVLGGVSHIQLARNRAVYEQIKAWCSPEG